MPLASDPRVTARATVYLGLYRSHGSGAVASHWFTCAEHCPTDDWPLAGRPLASGHGAATWQACDQWYSNMAGM